MEGYFSGGKLYGDDFNRNEIEEWFKDEEEGYANLGSKDKEQHEYAYHALNDLNGFSFLPERRFQHVVGIGSAYGDEIIPMIKKAQKITILEPSDAFKSDSILGVPVTYKKPNPNGLLPFEDNSIDLITCFGVLHHIPNVSTVIGEMYRVLSPGGYILLREPTVSMGDWRKPRQGLTKRERGIPLRVFDDIILSKGFTTVKKQRCMFPLNKNLKFLTKETQIYNSPTIVKIDRVICSLLGWNKTYHATNSFQKLGPTSIFYVLFKAE